MFKFSQKQFENFDAIALEAYLSDLRAFLDDHYGDVLPMNRDALFSACRNDCEALGIETEYGLHAYFVLSFHGEASLHEEEEYATLHGKFLRCYGDPEILPITLYEKAYE